MIAGKRLAGFFTVETIVGIVGIVVIATTHAVLSNVTAEFVKFWLFVSTVDCLLSINAYFDNLLVEVFAIFLYRDVLKVGLAIYNFVALVGLTLIFVV
jgi:hypothetical protein